MLNIEMERFSQTFAPPNIGVVVRFTGANGKNLVSSYTKYRKLE